MERILLQHWLHIMVCVLLMLKSAESSGLYGDIVYVQSAVAKGAVCLDGSPPAYHFDKGFGTGVNSWLVHLEGGGWCNNVTSCLARKNTRLGSSTKMVKQLPFSGILSSNPRFNPDFYNWNRVKIAYCDGGSFTGDIEAVNPATKLYYRGARIFPAVMEDLLQKGLRNAKNAILSGCSAGGLSSILHCDSFKAFLPNTNVKCFADAGFFVDAIDVSGGRYIESYYNDVVTTHGSEKNLPQSCTSKMKPSLCLFFPQNVAGDIRTPLFIINSDIDSWQIRNILAPEVADPRGIWFKCKNDITQCSAAELQIIERLRTEFINALNGLGTSTSRGYFINSCYSHCQTEMAEYWFAPDSPKLNDTTIAKAAADWFYGRSSFEKIDCPYPCDKTCHNNNFLIPPRASIHY